MNTSIQFDKFKCEENTIYNCKGCTYRQMLSCSKREAL